jgi:hypothetical protein
VSAEQVTTATTDRKAPPRPVFETRDFYLACFLKCTGYDLIGLRATGRRRIFVFRDQPDRRCDVIAFYSNARAVLPLAFASTIKDLKALLHNA